MRLSLDKLNEDTFSNAKFFIVSTDGEFKTKTKSNSFAVSGLITSELVLSGSNEFSSPFEAIGQVKKAADLLNVIKTAASSTGYMASSGQVASFSKSQTVKYYTGSARPTFSIEAVFITTNSTDIKNTALYKVNKIMKLVYPTGTGEILTAPLKYTPIIKKGKTSILTSDVRGTVTLKVGTWFTARKLIVKDVSFTMSKEVTANGTPLYAVGSITLEPYKAISYEDYEKWFKR